ncbi:dihydrofolate synthase / folylpolyglutamate synthase [Nitrosomonas cryotolerans]|uniref:Dihydrofolate synthase/folylpolyglutamate synthase n=1 Tax=Nitrosomonas cryotolerans ATCC 49181 TaxID=1131553 RepID=A0A1N6IFU4_9PROT|nr:bifunctional tetrahydrofolate synthase/dihydrofolate synthase [Nitrosomonas cryotolerans]SFP81168.1 dihydrofolate synthase / folylpolyglutamate synthase [Nitrosomonas cryotolerans]SIO30861.1 dihydrofolate synthase / folylpolyglutamate synthase [Nitrosomonas cryotolerans ATCC 49181]
MTDPSIEPNSRLSDWLLYLEQLHPNIIDLGLERVNHVRKKLRLAPTCPLVIVGGTNGKGSVCAMLEAILTCAGYRVGCYTSPHLLCYNERIHINQRPISDDLLCQAFEVVESARIQCGVSLTYFEFGTLAAMHLFIRAEVDVAILEVGLGGRLDAVNIFDADCAILTSIDLDHMDYLGDTRDKIGFEKAGIFRKGKAAICSEREMPLTVPEYAERIGASLIHVDRDFGYVAKEAQWDFWGPKGWRHSLSHPALRGTNQLQNASTCLAALGMLGESLPTSMNDIRRGLLEVVLPGRFQVLPGQPLIILDVAHNPSAARTLAANLDAAKPHQYTYAVLAMLRDKDIAGVIEALKYSIDVWLISSIDSSLRGASADELVEKLEDAGITKMNGIIHAFSDTVAAFAFACEHASKNDRICVLGSFYTVGAVLQYQNMRQYR